MHIDDKDQGSKPDARDLINDEIHSLSTEAQALVEKREQAQQAISQIETRLTQIAGAVSSLHKLLGKID